MSHRGRRPRPKHDDCLLGQTERQRPVARPIRLMPRTNFTAPRVVLTTKSPVAPRSPWKVHDSNGLPQASLARAAAASQPRLPHKIILHFCLGIGGFGRARSCPSSRHHSTDGTQVSGFPTSFYLCSLPIEAWKILGRWRCLTTKCIATGPAPKYWSLNLARRGHRVGTGRLLPQPSRECEINGPTSKCLAPACFGRLQLDRDSRIWG